MLNKIDKKRFTLNDFVISPAQGTLSLEGEVVRLEPKVMEVLVYFAAHPGEVITREELERDVWRGALVGYDAVTSTIIKLRKALKDDAKHPRFIATVPKKGYQLITPVGDIVEGADKARTNHANSAIRNASRSRALIFTGLVLVVIVVLGWQWLSKSNKQQTVLPSLVVLPFQNIGVDEEHDVFVDGVTEDIITDLSRLSNLLVMSSNTTFKFKGQTITPQEIHKQLNVDFMVQGSARRHGDEIRINVQLVNAKTGFNLWAEHYDRKLEDVFSVQGNITNKLIEMLSIKLTTREKQHLAQRATNNLLAYDHFLEGQRLSKLGTKQSNQFAAEAYRKAIKIDPGYGRAYGALAFILAVDFRRGWTDTPLESLDRALALAEQGIGLNSSIPQTHWVLGYVHLMRKEHVKAEKAVGNAIAIAPNYADGYGLLALIYNNLGKPMKAIEFAEKGIKINPYYTWDYLFNLGWAHYALGNTERAISALEKAQSRNESAVPIKIFLATSYVQAGRLDDAEWVVEQLLVLNPSTTLSHTDNAIPISKPESKQQLLEDLRTAGLPE